jgi:hypothetical protein
MYIIFLIVFLSRGVSWFNNDTRYAYRENMQKFPKLDNTNWMKPDKFGIL